MWLSTVAFYYPAVWFSNSVLGVMPALTRVALFGYRMEHFTLLPVGAFVSSVPQDIFLTPWGEPAMDVIARYFLHGGRQSWALEAFT